MLEPEQRPIAEQRIGNHVPVRTNNSERVAAKKQVAKHEMFRSNGN
jgi:hypothetical protein